MSAKMLMICNQKGGVGKTTVTVNLAHALALRGRQVLIIDLDPQGQVSVALGVDREAGIFRWLLGGRSAEEVVRPSRRPNLWLIPGDKDTGVVQTVWDVQRVEIDHFKRELRPLCEGLHYILLDSGPSVGGLQALGMYAADAVLIPAAVDYLALDGVAKVFETLGILSRDHHWSGSVFGVLPTFYEITTRESRTNLFGLEQAYPERVLDALSRATVLRECAAHGETIFEREPRSRSAAEFERLAKEILKRL